MFHELSVVTNLVLFLGGAVVILWSGTRLERVTDTIAVRTGMGGALAGLVLLALATSLPEVATTATAVLRGNVELAVTNLLGGTAFQVVVLVIADSAAQHGPLTGRAPSFAVLIQGVALMAMLGLAVCGLALGEDIQLAPSVLGVSFGFNPVLLLLPLVYFAVIRLTQLGGGSPRWQTVGQADPDPVPASDPPAWREAVGRRLRFAFIVLAALVAVGGWVAASSADVIADQTGFSSGFVGATLLAAATSLPEISTTVAAARDGNHELAVANVMGSNGFDVALLALVSLLAGGAFAVTEASVFLAGLAVVLTSVYLVGLLQRSDRAVGRLGLDSVTVAVLYLAGVGVLFGLG